MLPGGPASKIGHRYETWWTVYQLLRMLQGATAELRIEVPGIDKAEFVVTTKGGTREYHQVKRSNQDGKWSLASLDGLLRSIHDLLKSNEDRFIFVSGSEARDLSELCSAARQAESIDEFEHRFIEAEDRRRNFALLRSYWGCDTSVAIEMLRRIDLKTIDEHELQEKVWLAVLALFIADHNKIVSELRSIVTDCVYRTLTRQNLVDILAKIGYLVQDVRTPEHASVAVEQATDRYLDSVRNRLIQKTLVSRAATKTLLSQLNEGASDCVVTGNAGTGKTACVIELVEALRKRAQPVMTLRVDRISSTTTTDLGRDLGLEGSPVLILAAAAEAAGRPGVLIVDQLDAVSNMSGRGSAAFDLVERLIQEARGVQARVHTVVVSRTFDWKNDSLLRGLLSDDHTHLDVTEFELEQVSASLKKAGFNPDTFQRRQLELLRLPQNLALFLESDFNPSIAPRFDTSTKLFDSYWQRKRSLVEEVTNRDEWMSVIEKLCDEMNSAQRLWVRRERLDSISSTYVRQLASEGVLTYDEHRYGFGHESFFDYCFARVFVNRSGSMTSFLKKSEQHLFRRSQVRQILSYCRDADRSRYMQELNDLLSDSEIRTHIKDLVFALLAEVTDPTEQEWAIWEEWTGAGPRAVDSDISDRDDLGGIAWRRFRGAKSWFSFINERGVIKSWLSSRNDRLADLAMSYLERHHAHAPDHVVALIEPYVDCGGKWPGRLCSLMRYTQHDTSRTDFDLVLRLVDNGTLDDTGHEPWLMLHGLEENRPEWVPEILAHYLRRRFVAIRASGNNLLHSEILHDNAASKMFRHAAEQSPVEFVNHVLPAVLHLSDSSLIEDQPPRRDAVWRIFIKSDHEDGLQACLSALASALSTLAGKASHIIPKITADLSRRDTYVANYLLQVVYRGAASSLADEAMSMLADQPWRLQCGFSDSPYWWTMELIRSAIPYCTVHIRERFEDVILNYVDQFERPNKEFRHNLIGRAAFHLLSVVPQEIRSDRANRYFGELERRFGRPDAKPRGIVGGFVRSPIGETATAAMTDDQWRCAIMKYCEDEPKRFGSDFLVGGARELSRVLETRAKEDPGRFAGLMLTLRAGINPVYLDHVLSALRDATIDTEVKLRVCRKAYAESRRYCGKSIADVLGNINGPLPQDALDMLQWLGTEHGDPQEELWRTVAESGRFYYGGDIYAHGINTARGRAAEAIHRLIFSDAAYIRRFQPTIERMIIDRSAAVRSCVAGVLRAVSRHDSTLGMSFFRRMDLKEERLLAANHVVEFVGSHLLHEFPALRPTVERMLRSSQPGVCEAGARLASIAAMLHGDAVELGEESVRGNRHQRVGVAQVAAANVSVPRFRTWCEARLPVLFDDEDAEVRKTAARCFGRLPAETLSTCEDLIEAFCNSAAFAENKSSLLNALEESTSRLPGITCQVCERSLNEPAMVADGGHAVGRDKYYESKLIFRTYQQHQNDQWASRSLDMIDRLCLVGHWDVESQFEEFDR